MFSGKSEELVRRLRRAVINVFDNAWQAIEQDSGESEPSAEPVIGITSRREGDRIEIAVSDNGPGISAEELEKIFVVLYSTRGFGVGLGMPTVKQIMQQHGGDIEIESDPGRGTRVVLWLPLASADDSEPELEREFDSSGLA